MFLGGREGWIIGNNVYTALAGSGKVVANVAVKSPPLQTGPFVLALLAGILVFGVGIGLMYGIKLVVVAFCAFLGIELVSSPTPEP